MCIGCKDRVGRLASGLLGRLFLLLANLLIGDDRVSDDSVLISVVGLGGFHCGGHFGFMRELENNFPGIKNAGREKILITVDEKNRKVNGWL